ncbi:MAG: hypothetical protein ACKODX_15790, partial [Gemmata sp.]
MSIVAQCPHCETRFTLQPELSGKSMRCPNLQCRQVFTVKPLADKGPALDSPPAAKAAPKPPDSPPAPKSPAKKPVKPAVIEAEVVEAKVVEASVVPPKVKEVVWSEGTEVPPPAGDSKPAKAKRPLKAALAEAEEDGPLPVRRKKQKNRGPVILIGMAVAAVALVGFAAVYLVRHEIRAEERLADQAKDEYKGGNYGAAAKSYEKLAAEYPGSSRADEYKFFADLAATQSAVRSVTNRDDYVPAVVRLKEFIEAHKESPHAKPATGFGTDVLEAGKKLGEDIAAHAGDRVKEYQGNRTRSAELTRAEKAVEAGRDLMGVIKPFRGPNDPPVEQSRAAVDLDKVEQDLRRERERAAVVARAREQLDGPTALRIRTARADLKAAGLADDTEAKALIAEAKGKLRALMQYRDDPAVPQVPPPTAAASLLFVAPVGKAKLREPVAGEPA